jgi:hypothetical protein
MADKNKNKGDDDVLDPDAVDALTDDVDTEEDTSEWEEGGGDTDEEEDF